MTKSNSRINKLLKDYLQRMKEIRGGQSSDDETPYYQAFENLMNSVADCLGVDLVCNSQPSSDGGRPDYGFFSKSRCADGAAPGTNPEFGVIEMKRVGTDVRKTAENQQVRKYLTAHGKVLVCNYHEFLLVELDRSGETQEREFFSLTRSRKDFWELANDPAALSGEHASSLARLLWQIAKEPTELSSPEEIAKLLAIHAQRALERLKTRKGGDLKILREILEQSLRIDLKDADQDRLFRSTLVQTLFYGLFSVWAREGESEDFNWSTAKENIPIPVIRSLFEQLTLKRNRDIYELDEILERAASAMSRINRDTFFDKFKEDDAVQNFYELFLKEFDPAMRTEKGVWYTPRQIVRYMVKRVDHVLRTELDRKDGLADKSVYVLDPCCGTGAYILEVLRSIKDTCDDKEMGEGYTSARLREAAAKRVFGFELMASPLVIAHYQIGDFLDEFAAPPPSEKNESADPDRSDKNPSIYLTNSLNGWDNDDHSPYLPLAEFKKEYERARDVKQKKPILVIIGNPPYRLRSPSRIDGSDESLTKPYWDRDKCRKWGFNIKNPRALKDLYVKFFRIAENRINETEEGIVCFITNYSYMSEFSFPVMRNSLMESFDKIWIDSLNGSIDTNFLTPDGKTDLSVFKTDYNIGISLGTAVGLFVKKQSRKTKWENCEVRFREFWGTHDGKRQKLLESADIKPFDAQYEKTEQSVENGFMFSQSSEASAYDLWPSIDDLTEVRRITGANEARKLACIDLDKKRLRKRMKDYFDRSIEWFHLCEKGHPMCQDFSDYDARKQRSVALYEKKEIFKKENLVKALHHPFDVRYAYHPETRGLWAAHNNKFRMHMKHKDGFLGTRRSRKGHKETEGFPVIFTRHLGTYHMGRGDSWYFPLKRRFEKKPPEQTRELWNELESDSTMANLSAGVREWLSDLGLEDPDKNEESSDLPWLHVLAITWSPAYLSENLDNLTKWPRIPLPADAETAKSSAHLGREVMNLLDTKNDVEGVTSTPVAGHLALIGQTHENNFVITSSDTAKNPRGYEEKWSDAERRTLAAGFKKAGIEIERGFELLGPPLKVAINDSNCWKRVPKAVYECSICGYQPVKNWINSRKKLKNGKQLKSTEVEESIKIMRRIAALILMGDRLDANYTACRDTAWEWSERSMF